MGTVINGRLKPARDKGLDTFTVSFLLFRDTVATNNGRKPSEYLASDTANSSSQTRSR